MDDSCIFPDWLSGEIILITNEIKKSLVKFSLLILLEKLLVTIRSKLSSIILPSPKHNFKDLSSRDLYSTPCYFDAMYIGETVRLIKARLPEHHLV